MGGIKNTDITFILVMIIFLLFPLKLAAQLTVVQGSDMGLTPEQLIRDHLIGKGVSISNVTLNGSSDVISKNHIGYFHTTGQAGSQLNIESGIIMTTGRAENAIGPNNKPDMGSRSNTGPDADLELMTTRDSFDACVIEFDFIPQCDTMRFRYAFGSEEFLEFCGHVVNDAFGFFLSGPGIEGQFSDNSINIARMPGSSEYITINNICANPALYWDNQSGSWFQYDAITHVFTAWYLVAPYKLYHLKLAIADIADWIYDSGVFLEMGSFSAGFDFDVRNVPSNPGAGDHAVEGCNDIAVAFILPTPASIEMSIEYTIEGTAINGVDYTWLPSLVTFHPGDDSVSIVIHPVDDGIQEGPETVILNIHKRNCYQNLTVPDTIVIYDNMPMMVSAGADITICPGDTVVLTAHVSGGSAPFSYLWKYIQDNDSTIVVSPDPGSHLFIVEVTDGCHHADVDTVIVGVEPVARLTNQPASKSICDGDATEITLISNITEAYFTWDPEAVTGNVTGYSAGNGNHIDQILTTSDAIPATINYRIQVSGNHCIPTDTGFLVTVNPLPIINLGEPVYLEPGGSITLHAGGGFTSYQWSNETSDSIITINQGGIYWVLVENIFGCTKVDSVIVNEFGLYLPNAFTPDGDGLNDRFRVPGFEQQWNVLMQIFDRWGGLVFETRNLDTGWDGSCGNQLCNPGTYVWVIHIRISGEKVFKGTVTLIK
jgi:gliding motility-associated-like protein